MKNKINAKLIFNIISMLVPIGFILYFLLSEKGLFDLMQTISKVNKWWIFAGVFCQLMNIFIDAFILCMFTNNYNKKSYSLKNALKVTAVGQFYSVITPAAVGGQPMQLYCMKNQNIDSGLASSCLLQKFLVYQTSITIYSFIAMICNLELFYGDLKNLMLSLALFGFLSHVIIVCFMFIFSFNKSLASSIVGFFFKILSKIKIIKNPEEKREKIQEQITFFHDSNSKLYKNKKLLFITCLLTFTQLTLIFIIPYTIYRSFNLQGAQVSDMITAQAFVTMVSSFMPLPGGSGAAEGSFYVFFKIFFMESTIKSAILIWRIITYFLNIIIFAPFANISKMSNKKEEGVV